MIRNWPPVERMIRGSWSVLRRRSAALVIANLCLSLLGRQAGAAQIKPVINAQLLGGQYFYNGSDHAFGTLASLSAAPYVQFNDDWSLVPLYSGSYRGTKQVADLLGGGTLFQDSQNHIFSTKGVRAFKNGVKVKAVVGYGFELLRETTDENWGKGLYDNRKLNLGTEAEWDLGQERSLRVAYDYYQIRFPNYRSLASEASSSGLGRELSDAHALDTKNHAFTFSGQTGLPGNGLLEGSYSYTRRPYDNQYVVDASGSLIGTLRHDSLHSLSTQGTWPVWVESDRRLFGSFGYTWSGLFSNQAHYDASQLVYTSNYYGYQSHALQTEWSFLSGDDPWMLRLTGTVARQGYAERRVQDAAGLYGNDTTHVDSASVALTFTYPIAKGFHLTALTALGWNDSNNHYTKVYQYHYNTATYLMGFRYAY